VDQSLAVEDSARRIAATLRDSVLYSDVTLIKSNTIVLHDNANETIVAITVGWE
jgi:hypothetical protein